MKSSNPPVIQRTSFGSIVVEGKHYEHDIYISLEGEVKKRKKKLSKQVYGTSHIISRQEAEFVYEQGAEGILIGSGQYGAASLSEEAASFLKQKNCKTAVLPTPEAVRKWNETREKWIGLFHITC